MTEASMLFLETKLEKIERLLKHTDFKVHFEERDKPNTTDKWFLAKVVRGDGRPLIFGFGKDPEAALVAALKRTTTDPIKFVSGHSMVGDAPEIQHVQHVREGSQELGFSTNTNPARPGEDEIEVYDIFVGKDGIEYAVTSDGLKEASEVKRPSKLLVVREEDVKKAISAEDAAVKHKKDAYSQAKPTGFMPEFKLSLAKPGWLTSLMRLGMGFDDDEYDGQGYDL